jgi:dihydropteroate synthase
MEKLQESIAPISADEAKSRVIPPVNDAIKKILEVGIPYLVPGRKPQISQKSYQRKFS